MTPSRADGTLAGMSTRVKALIVDDAVIMRRLLKDILVAAGFLIVGEAGDGEEAVRLAELHRPHLITLDITMPKMDGLTALKKIKEIDKDMKVVMVSAMGQRENVIEAIKNGAENFIVKPFNAEKIHRVLKGLKFEGRLQLNVGSEAAAGTEG